jgi:hypothetical protein
LALDFDAVALGVVFVDFTSFFFADGLVRAVAIGLILREPAHADPYGFFLGLDFERAEIGFQDFAHGTRIKGKL